MTEYVSLATFLPVVRVSSTPLPKEMGGGALSIRETFSDWREVDGEKIAFKSVTKTPTLGLITSQVQEAAFNVSVTDSRFRVPQAAKSANKVPANKTP